MKVRFGSTVAVAVLSSALVISAPLTASAAEPDGGLLTAALGKNGGAFADHWGASPITAAGLATPGATQTSGILLAVEAAPSTSYALAADAGGRFIAQWNRASGAESSRTYIDYATARYAGVSRYVAGVKGLDVTPDGRILVLTEAWDDSAFTTGRATYVAAVSPSSGALDLLGALPDAVQPYLYEGSIATDPVTGSTFAFTETADGTDWAIPVDLASGAAGTPLAFAASDSTRLTDPQASIMATDFDSDGTLWFTVGIRNVAEYVLASLAGPASGASWTSATVSSAAPVTGFTDERKMVGPALTVAPTAPPAGTGGSSTTEPDAPDADEPTQEPASQNGDDSDADAAGDSPTSEDALGNTGVVIGGSVALGLGALAAGILLFLRHRSRAVAAASDAPTEPQE